MTSTAADLDTATAVLAAVRRPGGSPTPTKPGS